MVTINVDFNRKMLAAADQNPRQREREKECECEHLIPFANE